MNKPRILFWDLETSLSIVTTFTLKTDYISHESILQDWNIISGAWKFSGDSKVHAISVGKDPSDDKHVVEVLRDVIDQADIIVHHNGDKFDIKKFNTRLLLNGLPPIDRRVLTVDTLKEARKTFSFLSNRLDYLAQVLGIGAKLPHSTGLWLKALRGDRKAVKEMVEYNKYDVSPLLEGVYEKLKPYINHPNVAAFMNDDRPRCTHCGKDKLEKRGYATTKAGLRYARFQCKGCSAWSQSREAESTKPVLK